MNFADRIKEVTTSTGTGSLTLAGAATGFRAFSPAIATGSQIPYGVSDALGNWEVGYGVLTATTTLTRSTVLASSNANALVNFPAGSKDVFLTLPAALIAAFQVSQDVPFAAAVPLTAAGTQYMPQQVVASVIAFTVAASPVKGASVYVRLIADGVNVPTFTGMKEWGGSLGYDNRSRIVNEIQFFYDGYDVWYSISQAVGAVAEPVAATGVTLTGPASGVVSTASSNFTVGVTPVGGTISGTVVVTPSDAGGGGTFSPTSVNLTSGAPTATFTYTPNATVTTRTISVTNNGGLSNPASISYSVLAAPTVPGAPTIGAATGGDASASVTFTAPGSNGGSAILDYTVTASPGGATATGAASPITVSGLTNGTAYTFTVKARNAVGSSAASAASNSVTPAAAAAYARLTNLTANITESGTGPYSYAANSVSGYSSGGVTNKARTAGADCSYAFTVANWTNGTEGESLHGLTTSTTPTSFDQMPYYVFLTGVGGPKYMAGQLGNPNITPNGTAMSVANGDIVRLRLVGTSMTIEVARAATPASFTVVHTFTSVPSTAYRFQSILQGVSRANTIDATGLA